MIGSLIVTVLAIGGIVVLFQGSDTGTTVPNPQTNITIVDGKQVIHIRAKGGYAPKNTVAKANMPTTINVVTNGTYDCSAALNVPGVGFQKYLPTSGTTPIEIPSQQPVATIRGVCAMGMYSFTVSFE